MSESKRGGARPGDRRPATGKTTEYITHTLPKELAQKNTHPDKNKEYDIKRILHIISGSIFKSDRRRICRI